MKTGSKGAGGALAAFAALTISAAGILFIKSEEGTVKRQGQHVAYPDPGTRGVPWTACYGSTEGVRPGMVFTDRECDERLRNDIRKAEDAIRRHVRVPLSQPEYDAYVSFIFNVGETNFRNSTLLRYLNQGQRSNACNQLPRWVFANKKVMPGLVKRRNAEKARCLQFNKDYVYVPRR
jgi:lysozyme